MNKYLKIALVILIIGAAVIGGIYLWKAINSPGGIFATKEQETPAPITNLSSKLKKVSDDEISDYWINSKTGAVYYLNTEGQIVKISTEGEKTIVNSQTLNQLNGIKISPDGTFIVAQFNYPSLPTFSLFDTVTGNWQPLPQNIISAAFSPNSQQLAYIENKENNGRLAVYNISSKKIQEIIKITQKDAELNWVKNDEIFLSQKPSFDLKTSLYSININDKTIKPLIKDEGGLDIVWSNNSGLGIQLKNTDKTTRSSIIDTSGNELATLSFVILPEKCLIDQSKIYCGVPQNLREGLHLPDDYYKKAVYFQDDLESIDLSNGQAFVLFNNRDNILIDAYRLSLNLGKNQLYFINRYDQKLYSLALE